MSVWQYNDRDKGWEAYDDDKCLLINTHHLLYQKNPSKFLSDIGNGQFINFHQEAEFHIIPEQSEIELIYVC